MPIEAAQLDQMQQQYKAAVEDWIAAIRNEEALASPAEHSEAQIDQWEAAAQREEAARTKAKAAKSSYESGLREEFFHF